MGFRILGQYPIEKIQGMYNKTGVCEEKKKGYVPEWRRREIIFLEFVEERGAS